MPDASATSGITTSSPSDPGPSYPNFLSTMGRLGGTVFFRWLLPKAKVQRPQAEVVKLADLQQ